MNELTLTRGRDVGLYLDGELLCGVTRMHAISRYRRHEMYEYLSGEPYDTVPAGERHEIVLTVLSLFGGSIPMNGSFELKTTDGDTEYRYEGCTVTRCDRDVRGDQPVSDRWYITANRMTKRRVDHAR